ncbi:MAG: ATP-dependent sacrificial sulfur transferase LarE [Bacteroidales bacterium]|nr:ATP-dependent sacrificial sulfur transferase LarE [Bacteroidales bacterium]
MPANNKIEKIYSSFNSGDNILVAFSGGVDSSFLLYVLKTFSDVNVSAVTIKTPYIPQWEVDEAINFCKSLDINHSIIQMPLHKSIIMNPDDRCYRCKSILFNKIREYAAAGGFNIIADGSNADDKKDYRPGMKALTELDITSPLLEAGFTKDMIREYLKDFGLEIWNKPAYACLLTRIPYNTQIDMRDLNIIEESERYLHKLGFPGTRVRLHDNMARIETNSRFFEKMIETGIRTKIIHVFKAAGIKFISLDLEGYRMGSLNPKTPDNNEQGSS